MAPKLAECFAFSDNGTQVYCKICTPGTVGRKLIGLKSAANHLKSTAHKAEVARQASSRLQEQQLRAEQTAELQQKEVELQPMERSVHLHAPSVIKGPSFQPEPDTPPVHFWDNADYNLPDPVSNDEELNTLKEGVERLMDGWDDEKLASAIGLEEVMDQMNLEATHEEEEQMLADMMENAANHDEVLDALLHGETTGATDAQWHPYESKTMCILDILDNLPRLRISNSLMKMIIWAMKECGAQDVPSFYSLRKVQRNLQVTQGIPNIECQSAQGKIFYINDPRSIIANDWANPSVRKLIQFYPEIPDDGVVREVWHADKWQKMDPNLLSPMYDAGNGQHFYVFELLRLKSLEYFIPIRWIIKGRNVHAEAHLVQIDESNVACIDDSNTVMINSHNFESNYLDLEAQGSLPKAWSNESVSTGYPAKMPNHFRELAQGDPLYVSFIDYFGDDVSGNRSKSWNKHNNSYISHRNLPRKVIHQEFHVHLISTSQFATIPEQYHDVKKVIDNTRVSPVRVEDENGLGMRFMLQLHAETSDNPAQSEVACHIGSGGNHLCRKCNVGGSEQEKSTNEGFHSMFMLGNARTQESIRRELEIQVNLACRGVSKPIAERQTQIGTKDAYTQFWIEDILKRHQSMRAADPSKPKAAIEKELLTWVTENSDKIYNSFINTEGFDPAKDTPVEILHTILLGIVKYIWHYTHTTWKPAQKQLYAQRLQATDMGGLSLNPIRANYIITYAGSLVGRQFKTVIQTAVFHLYDLVDEKFFKAWHSVGTLAAILWITEIDDMDQYCDDLEIAIANVQDMFAEIDPTKILRKAKIHLVRHTPEDARLFGPLVGMATEVFESFNAVFRFCSVLSNHLAPSRDISRQTGGQESMKQRLSGGRAFDVVHQEWVSSGPSVRNLLKEQSILQSVLGWTNHVCNKPGSIVKIPLPRKSAKEANTHIPREYKLNDTKAKFALNFHQYSNSASAWIQCKSVVAVSSDICTLGAWVFYKSPVNQRTVIGRINAILTSASETESLVILEEFQVGPNLDAFFQLPYVFRRQGEVSYIIVSSMDILFNQNVQHDCRTAKCAATGIRNRLQERQESGQTESFIEHLTDDRFLINLNAFHNTHLIRRVLPRELTAPVLLFPDREVQHHKNAEVLRKVLFQRKEQTQKRKEERQKKKAGEEQAQGAGEDDGRPSTKKRKAIREAEELESEAEENHSALQSTMRNRRRYE